MQRHLFLRGIPVTKCRFNLAFAVDNIRPLFDVINTPCFEWGTPLGEQVSLEKKEAKY